ncbi:MAG: hypothetical protein QME12_05675 [Nanoarchaeota archaeon]|nr:hypothetical protein [Nanoarchaeota archaeon]
MCEYCNANDINRIKAFDIARDYMAMEMDSIVSIDAVFEHMLAIYNNVQMADCAVKRIECRNVKCTPKGRAGVLAKDVLSELEQFLSCCGHMAGILDG